MNKCGKINKKKMPKKTKSTCTLVSFFYFSILLGFARMIYPCSVYIIVYIALGIFQGADHPS